MVRVIINIVLTMLILFSWSTKAWYCGVPYQSTLVSPQNITVPYELPVGSVLSQVTTPFQNKFLCSDTEAPLTNQSFGVKAIGTYVTNINNQRIYATNVNGIGYSIAGSTTSCGYAQGAVSGNNTINGKIDTFKLCENPNGMIATELNGQWTITFYKTAQDTGSGVVSGGVVGAFSLLSNTLIWWNTEPTVTVSSFNVISPACKITSAVISIPMGSVDKNAFNGEGTSPGEQYTKPVDIPLTCNAGTNVKVKFEGNAFDAAKGVIKTTSGNNSASGVGIQLLYNNVNILLGEYLSVGNSSSGGSFIIPMKARYYQTGATITPGDANGVVTFSLIYD